MLAWAVAIYGGIYLAVFLLLLCENSGRRKLVNGKWQTTPRITYAHSGAWNLANLRIISGTENRRKHAKREFLV